MRHYVGISALYRCRDDDGVSMLSRPLYMHEGAEGTQSRSALRDPFDIWIRPSQLPS